jgi:hypothetical protein
MTELAGAGGLGVGASQLFEGEDRQPLVHLQAWRGTHGTVRGLVLQLVVVLGELGGIVGVVVEILRLNIDRLWILLRLIQLLDDVAPHFLRHHGFHSIEDLVDLKPHLGDLVALVALV